MCSYSLTDHEKSLTKVLSKLRKAGLKLEFNKWIWVREEVNYLGHRVSKKRIKISLDQNDSNVCFAMSKDFTAEKRLEVLSTLHDLPTIVSIINTEPIPESLVLLQLRFLLRGSIEERYTDIGVKISARPVWFDTRLIQELLSQ